MRGHVSSPLARAAVRAAQAVAPSNIAFIKYWGAADLDRAIPLNASLSMTLTRSVSQCDVEPVAAARDEVWLRTDEGEEEPAPEGFTDRVRRHLERLRSWSGRDDRFRVGAWNSFPTGAGLASSASGFAALTLAAMRAWELDPDSSTLSLLARRSGSGSAARSVLGGFVQWPCFRPPTGSAQETPVIDPEGPAVQLAPASHWDLRDVICIIDPTPKATSSRDGHRRAASSPHMSERLRILPSRFERVQRAIHDRDIATLGETIEEEAVELHLVAMSSRPPIFYWQPGTLEVMAEVGRLREDGVPAYFTIDAGPNVHVICPEESEQDVCRRLGSLAAVRRLIRDRVGDGGKPEVLGSAVSP